MALSNLEETGGAITRMVVDAGEWRVTARERLSVFYCLGRRKLFFILLSFSIVSLIAMVSVLLHPEPANAGAKAVWQTSSCLRLKLGAWEKFNEADEKIVHFFVTSSSGQTFRANRTIGDRMSEYALFPDDFIDKKTGNNAGINNCFPEENVEYAWRIVVDGKVLDSGKIKFTRDK